MKEALAQVSAGAAGGRMRSRYDRRIPPPGTLLSRDFGGETITVKVLLEGFEHQGRCYRSLERRLAASHPPSVQKNYF